MTEKYLFSKEEEEEFEEAIGFAKTALEEMIGSCKNDFQKYTAVQYVLRFLKRIYG